MKIEISNKQDSARPNVALIKKLAGLLMERVSQVDPRARWEELSVVLLDDAGIARVNSQCLNSDDTTDVLSFRYDSICGNGDKVCGEILVNVECAVLAGPSHGSASSELALYIAHGCDHLSGADDAIKSGRRQMRARELRWLKQIGKKLDISNLLSDAT